MPEPKRRRKPESFIEMDSEEFGFALEPTQVEVGSGYTISVGYDKDEKLMVDVKTYGEIDTAKIRREIEKAFPNAFSISLRILAVSISPCSWEAQQPKK